MKTIIFFKSTMLLFALVGTLMIVSCGDEEPMSSCTDGVKNGTETGIDCGGDCTACPTCTDGVQNGDETGVDCGGDCTACATCDDGIQNGDEIGVDCGGVECTPCYGVGLAGPGGGVIFYDKGSYSEGWRYLEAANNDIECGVPNCGVEHVNDRGTKADVGAGKSNTEILESVCSTILPIETISEGGVSDWYMPSDGELLLMQGQRAIIPNLVLDSGECKSYWSSTLAFSSAGVGKYFLRVMNMVDGQLGFTQPGQLTRPIRQF